MNENKEVVWYKSNEELRPILDERQTNNKFMIARGVTSKAKIRLKVWDISRKKDPETLNGEEYRKFLIKAFAETSKLLIHG